MHGDKTVSSEWTLLWKHGTAQQKTALRSVNITQDKNVKMLISLNDLHLQDE